MWNQKVQNHRTIPDNKPDITIRDNEEGTFMLINNAVAVDRNVIKKESEKILKCKQLTIEIQCKWNVTAKVIPVIIGATGTISKISQTIPERHTRKARNEGNTKIAILGTAHILRRGSADVRVQNIFHGAK